MTIDYQKLRLLGVYQQDKDDNLMLRVKIPAGVLSSEQASEICALSDAFSNGILHLTSRGSIEFHWLRHAHLETIFYRLDSVGLTTRGACGGAVRGISCSTTFAPGFPEVQRIAQKLNRHFAGNPEFEGLPKKFKISIDAGYQGARHLIQDIGIVMVNRSNNHKAFDIWCAGGLGREPQTAFLLEEAVAEDSLIHLVESVVQVYRDNTPPPKRLKYLLNSIGETEFRTLLQAEMLRRAHPKPVELENDTPIAAASTFVEVPVFAGEIKASNLSQLAAIAAKSSNGLLATTTDQNIALLATSEEVAGNIRAEVDKTGLSEGVPDVTTRFRVCPGSHECRMGLAPTRDIAEKVIGAMSTQGNHKSWALSGCHNSCSQPQLANYGIVTKKLLKNPDGTREPLFDLYHRAGDDLGTCIAKELTINALCELVRTLK